MRLWEEADLVSPLEFLFDDPASQFLGVFRSINRDRPPLLKIVIPPAPGDNHRAGEEQGSLNRDQVPPIQVVSGLDMAQQNQHTHNLAHTFQERKGRKTFDASWYSSYTEPINYKNSHIFLEGDQFD